MQKNAYFLAKIGADTAENEQHCAEFGRKLATTPAIARSAKPTSAYPFYGASLAAFFRLGTATAGPTKDANKFFIFENE